MENIDGTVSWIQRQYFQAVAMKYFDWDSLKSNKSVEQEIILKATCLHSLSQKYPPSNPYKLAFLKTLLAIYEEQGREICDEMYSCIADIIAKKQNQEDNFNYKSYILPCGRAITLCESSQFISQGTTGLNSWQAGKFLSNWIIQNKDIVCGKYDFVFTPFYIAPPPYVDIFHTSQHSTQNNVCLFFLIFLVLSRNVLELGCGVGLSGLVALHYCRPKTYFFTDCHEKVLQKIQINLEINGFVQADKCQQIFNTLEGGSGCTNELNSRQSIPNQDHCSSENEICKEQQVHLPRQDIRAIGCPLYFDESFSSCENFRNFPPFWHVKSKDCGFQRENLEKCSTHAVACHLDWQNWTPEQAKEYSPDVILAADVIFDPHVIDPLVNVIKTFLSIGRPRTVAFIASTVRNKETYEKFILSLDSSGIKKLIITDVPEKLFFYNTTSEILLLKLEL